MGYLSGSNSRACRRDVTIWLRLIGPGQALNFKLNVPAPGSPVAAMEFSAEPKPDACQELTEYNVGIRGCFFADPCAFLHQHSLDKWTSRGYTAHERGIETLLWAFVMSSLSPGTKVDSCTGFAFVRVWRLKMLSRCRNVPLANVPHYVPAQVL